MNILFSDKKSSKSKSSRSPSSTKSKSKSSTKSSSKSSSFCYSCNCITTDYKPVNDGNLRRSDCSKCKSRRTVYSNIQLK